MRLYKQATSKAKLVHVNSLFLALTLVYIARIARERWKIHFRATGIRSYVYRQCPDAYVRARSYFYSSDEAKSRSSTDRDPNSLSERIISELSEQVYILCVHCNSSRIPVGSEKKTTFVQAQQLDACLQLSHLSHYVKVSIAHAHILETVRTSTTHSAVAVLEEDTISVGDYTTYTDSYPTAELLESLRNENWKILRLGYKPYFLVDNTRLSNMLSLPKSCHPKCKCSKFHEHACTMYHRGCDMRSSDAYIIRRHALTELGRAIETGHVIDVHAMRAVSQQAFLVPQLNFQSAQTIEGSRKLAKIFEEICVS